MAMRNVLTAISGSRNGFTILNFVNRPMQTIHAVIAYDNNPICLVSYNTLPEKKGQLIKTHNTNFPMDFSSCNGIW